MENTANRIALRGSLMGLPVFSHENHGRRFYRFALEVQRLSGAADILQVVVDEETLHAVDLSGGDMVAVTGQIRSFNSKEEVGRKLIITVFADEMTACDGESVNEVDLRGAICKEPIYRRTPLGREICDIMLAVNRPYRRTDYLPCILWGKTAQDAAQLGVGARLHLSGRLQSREYVKLLETGSERRTAYEISAIAAEPDNVEPQMPAESGQPLVHPD